MAKKRTSDYTVLARRYRPRQFADLIGQEPVAQALVNALESNRVAHAYLFTGARGVGKTSTARILAKALNCDKGPTQTPCDKCDACMAIAAGEDVDVLEIDGASNRGIDEVRELRRNVALRPSRSRYKIYIIDEVHMLTKEAFNALLKTLEEPPPHVKFIFATTEVQKIPVTILSRCQRFDFAGIGTSRIVDHLKQVVAGEGLKADDEALDLIARRAGGSMRDAQSLLDQLLAFGEGGTLTAEQVHNLLGTANDDRIVEMAKVVLARDAAQAFALLGGAIDQGLQLGELVDQLIDYWRDLMVVNCAGTEGQTLSVASRFHADLAAAARALSLDTILAGLDVLSTTKARMRASGHGRVLVEMALIRLSRMEDLISLSQLAGALNGAGPAMQPTPKEGPPSEKPPSLRQAAGLSEPRSSPSSGQQPAASISSPAPTSNALALTDETIGEVWRRLVTQVGGMLAGELGKGQPSSLAAPATLVVAFPEAYNKSRDFCQEPSRLARIEEVLARITGKAWKLRFETARGATSESSMLAAEPEKPARQRQQRAEVEQEPLIKHAIDALGAQLVQVDEGFALASSEAPDRATEDSTEEV